jgi:uncharacterized membrane protein
MTIKTQVRKPLVDTPPARVIFAFFLTFCSLVWSSTVAVLIVISWFTIGFDLGELGWMFLALAMIPAVLYGFSLVTRKWYMNGKNLLR